MPQTWIHQPYEVLIVSGERELLRRISRFLALFRYCVREVTSVDAALERMQVAPPDFLIVDAAISDQPHRLLHTSNTYGPKHPVYSFLLVSEPTEQQLDEALQAGADDVLTRPLICGELLARLRTAARMLEFDRRYERQFLCDPQTGWLSENELLQLLERKLNSSATDSVGCALLDVDQLECINRRHGYPIGDALLAALIERLTGWEETPIAWARVEGGRFAALLDCDREQLTLWSENAAGLVSDRPFLLDQLELRCTASIGFASRGDEPVNAAALWQRTNEALVQAKQSGRNCVVAWGAFADETRDWEEWATSGRLFETTLARDVMTPIPTILRTDHSPTEAWSLLRSCQLPHLPVVDSQGQLVGLLPRAVAEQPSLPASWIDSTLNGYTTFPLETPFTELMEHLTHDESDLPVVVIQQGRPAGVIYREGLAALCEELHTGSFATENIAGTQTLRVPDPAVATV